MSSKPINLLFVIAFSLTILFMGPALAADNTQKASAKTSTKHNLFKKKRNLVKSLSLADFPLVSEFSNDKKKLQKYTTEVLQEQYKATPAVFSSSIPYGLALIDLNQIDRAYDVFERAEKDFIGNPAPKAYKGWSHARKGEYEEAYEYLYPLAKEKHNVGVVSYSAGLWLPPHIDSIAGLAVIKDKLPKEQRKNIDVILKAVLKHFKWQPKFAAINAVAAINDGKFDEAKQAIEYVKSKGFNYPLLDTLLGVISYAHGDFEESLNYYDDVISRNPYSPLNYVMKSRSFIALGEKDKAIEAVDFALEMDPDFELAQAEKERILNPRRGFFSTIAGIFTRDNKEN